MFDRTAIVGYASNWVNWTFQLLFFGTGVVAYHMEEMPMSEIVTLVVSLSLAEGAARLARKEP